MRRASTTRQAHWIRLLRNVSFFFLLIIITHLFCDLIIYIHSGGLSSNRQGTAAAVRNRFGYSYFPSDTEIQNGIQHCRIVLPQISYMPLRKGSFVFFVFWLFLSTRLLNKQQQEQQHQSTKTNANHGAWARKNQKNIILKTVFLWWFLLFKFMTNIYIWGRNTKWITLIGCTR